MSRKRNYWGFRISTDCPDYPGYYNSELNDHGVLRQGWGYKNEHNLHDLSNSLALVPKDQTANLRMYNEVKKGDIILIPRVPNWNLVTIAEATDDWDNGYKFEIDEKMGDYGHQFPARYRTHFSRDNTHVRSDIRSTLKCQLRFWSMSDKSESIDLLLPHKPDVLTDDVDKSDRFNETVLRVINKERFEDEIHKKLSEQFGGSGWEYALVTGLIALFPCYDIERTGGSSENKHGTDILITMPGPLDNVRYGIALQVKDWEDKAWNIDKAINQIKKADEAWKELRPGLIIVEKIIVLTKAEVPVSESSPEITDITIMDYKGLKKLLRRMALAIAVTSGK